VDWQPFHSFDEGAGLAIKLLALLIGNSCMDSTAFQVFAIIGITLLGGLIFLALFEPALRYKIARAPNCRLDSDPFLRMIEALSDAKVATGTRVDVLTNGENFYEAELDAIRAARRTINLEAYIFQRGRLTCGFLAALTERAIAGVKVRLVIDSIGSFTTWNRYFRELRQAGGRVEWYHPFRWYTWPRINNRTHRELLIVDGKVGFLGGAGFADHWIYGHKKHPRWRDSMFRVEGEAVTGLQATFAENWLESSGEILIGEEYFPFSGVENGGPAMVIDSTPSSGSSTHSRILFQTLVASAKESIHITTPYFLPDRSMRRELIRAVQRGVDLKIITPGMKADHLLTRTASRRLYGSLLAAGAKIYEYQPSMMHAKTLIVDALWSVVGSTNFDHRSFGLNDEVNLASVDRSLAARLESDFARDLEQCCSISYDEWRRRSILVRCHEVFGWLLERQQ
jgi:cardiolipin synthase